jgi:hypothetical protein
LPAADKHAGGEKDHGVMALTQDDFVGAVARLNDLTRGQVIKLLPCSAPTSKPTAAFRSTADMLRIPKLSFETTYEDRTFRIT